MHNNLRKIKLHVSKGAIITISGLILLLNVAALTNITSGLPQDFTLEYIFLVFSALYFATAAVLITLKKKKSTKVKENEKDFQARF